MLVGLQGIERAGWIVPPRGWYADPTQRFDQRLWDRREWTDKVMRGWEAGHDPI